MDRRTTLQWVLAASAAWPALRSMAAPALQGYGGDPNAMNAYARGALWPLTLSAEQRRLAGTLADLIIPADERSPSATAVGVVDFIDEWISAPYSDQQLDQKLVREGLVWLEQESMRRFQRSFGALTDPQRSAIADDICREANVAVQFQQAARFFARFRDLTAAGFYSTPVGRNDLQYLGNIPRAQADGPPPELLARLQLP